MATRKGRKRNEDIEAESTYCYDFPNLHLCAAVEKKNMIVIDLFQLSIFDSHSFIHSLLCLHLPPIPLTDLNNRIGTQFIFLRSYEVFVEEQKATTHTHYEMRNAGRAI